MITTHFEKSPSPRIVRSAEDEITAIQRLLSDVYRDTGDGRTLLRELMQNADDAQASRLAFAVVDQGLRDPQNTLLGGPGLMVVNDGSFLERDQRALHQAIGDAKSADTEKIGRFGVGLKSVFHVCEAFVYLGAEPREPGPPTLRPGALNPWAGTGQDGDQDLLHPDWDTLEPSDAQFLLEAARAILGSFTCGLLLWIPLRRRDHLDRAQEGEQDGLGTDLVDPKHVVTWFRHPDSLALVLAHCGHLRCVEAFRADTIPALDRRTALVRVDRPCFESRSWVGRYRDDDVRRTRTFKGIIRADDQKWSVAGVDAVGHERLREVRVASDWPKDRVYVDGRRDRVPRKALAHAAITVLHRPAAAAGGVRLRWAVFLPLDDAVKQPYGPLIETVECASSTSWWDIIMHGYFWPSHDRRSIPGVTDDESRVRGRWNRGIRDDLMLPLLPQALEFAVRDVPQDVAGRLLGAVDRTEIVRRNNAAITKNHVLLPVVTECGMRWKTYRTDEARVVAIPWKDAPSSVRKAFVRRIDRSDDVICIDDAAPRIGGTPRAWPADMLRGLLSCVSIDLLRTPLGLAWVEHFIKSVLERQHDDEDDARHTSVADWLAERIGEGALTACFDGPPDTRQDLRSTWRRVYEHLPKEWLIPAPVESQRAVVELADAKAVGAGLLPIPFGIPRETDAAPHPDPGRLNGALLALGNLLSEEGPQSAHDARLILAETLLATLERDARPLGNQLVQLPLIRALCLPEGRYEAWSQGDLHRQAAEHRVFARGDEPSSDQVGAGDRDGVDPAGVRTGRAGRAARQPRQAVKELAEAVGSSFWLVRSMPATAKVRPVSNEALAGALLHAKAISKDPEPRKSLLSALAAGAVGPLVGPAMRVLLTGVMTGGLEECDIYHVRSRDTEHDTNRRTLDILLGVRRQSWRVAEPKLIDALPQSLFASLRIKEIDPGVLQELLRETLDKSSDDDWQILPKLDVLHLLKHLYGTDRALWRAMPLHQRRITGDRGRLDDQTARATGGGRLPSELETEVILLEPDDEVADLYLDVPQLDDDGVLRMMLENEHPQRFVSEIIDRLRQGNQIILPQDPKLRDLLKNSPWLPGCDTGLGIAPGGLLCLPPELQTLVAPLAEDKALRRPRLSSQVAPDYWSVAKDVVHEILGRPSPGRQVERLADGLDRDAVAQVHLGCYLILPDAANVDQQLIKDALQSPLVDSHPGWTIVRAAANLVGTMGGNVPRAVSLLACAFCAPVPPDRQLSTLRHIAKWRPRKDSRTGHLFRRLVEKYAEADNFFFKEVLPYITLPTQDGEWRRASEIAQASFGVARGHRILQDLRPALRLDDGESDGKVASGETVVRSGGTSDFVFAQYFKTWTGCLNPGAVGALLSLFGNGNRIELRSAGNEGAMRRLAQRWLGEVDVSEVRRDLTGADERPFSTVPVFVVGSKEDGWVTAVNILGNSVKMTADPKNETIFATAPKWDREGFWEVALRHVEPSKHSAQKLCEMLGKTIELWAVKYLNVDRGRMLEWWWRWGTGSQAQVEPVRALILANLPLTLRRLDVRECPALQKAVTNAERAQRRRGQAAGQEPYVAADSAKQALDSLASLIDEPQHSGFLRGRVRERMESSGYTAESTLLELVQNADDALAQAREIAGRELSKDARSVVVRVDEHDRQPTVDVKHFGRPINDTGDAEFSARQDRQWDLDLYFMMLMDLTAKPGEASGSGAAVSTTGCFGLGFKSVHLVSDAPSVVSGYIAFSIAGGLLPKEEQVPDDPDLESVDGQQVTRVRLPLRHDDDLITRMFCRFRHTRFLLPAFARELRKIVVDGGPYPGVSVFDGEPIAGAQGWSIARTLTELPNGRWWRILRFRLGGAETGTAALVLGLLDGVPTPFPSDVPFLWNVTPTSERWGCGYAVNGPFKLDHGRTRVALDHEDTRRVALQLGEALGKGLVALHSALANDAGPACGLPGSDGVAAFTESLWNVLSSGIGTEFPAHRDFLGWLHGQGRGISAWMSACSVVPSKLPAPFGKQLPPLASVRRLEDMRIEFAEDVDLWRNVAGIEDLAQLARNHLVVSEAVAERLRRLLPRIEIARYNPMDLFSELVESWNHCLTPERLHALRPLEPEHVWKLIGAEWATNLVARSVDGAFAPLRELLLPPGLETADDEPKRAAFAPDTHILDSSAYITSPEDAAVFRRLRTRLQIDSATMASWFTDIADSKRRAALRYLLHGILQHEILAKLVPPEARPRWLRDRSYLGRMVNGLSATWRCDSLLAALFPPPEQSAPDTPDDPDTNVRRSPTEDFFRRLQDWWDRPSNRQAVLVLHENDTWPAWLRRDVSTCLVQNSNDHWLALLVLGACQRLGRSRPGQHRRFLETARSKEWWSVFKRPNQPSDWMEVLRSWHDSAVDHLEYSHWMSLFPTIYLLSRYLSKYRDLLRTADRRRNLDDLTRLLAPRNDSALSGTSRRFDAPPAPLNMGLHWILRELVRLKILEPVEYLLPYCWVPSDEVFRFLERFGLDRPERNASNSDKARTVYNFLKPRLGTPHLDFAFDIPLRYVATTKDEALLRDLGLSD